MKDQTACFVSLSFAGLVVLARSLNPIPSLTRPLNSSAPMVLWLKPWESRSLPGLPRTKNSSVDFMIKNAAFPSAWYAQGGGGVFLCPDVSPVSRSAAMLFSFGHDLPPDSARRLNHPRPLPTHITAAPDHRRLPCVNSFAPPPPCLASPASRSR